MASMGGGDDTTTTETKVDKKARTRFRKISDEAWNHYKSVFMPYEAEMVGASRELMPYAVDAGKASLEQIVKNIEAGEEAGIPEAFYSEAIEGLDIEGAMGEAQTNVESAFKNVQPSMERDLMRKGALPGSGITADMVRQNAIDRAKAISAARTGARRYADETNFGRLATARNAMTAGALPITQMGNYSPANPAGYALQGAQGLAGNVTKTSTEPGGSPAQFTGQMIGTAAGAMSGGWGYQAGKALPIPWS